MHNLSLVLFTLFIQSAAGIVWSHLAHILFQPEKTIPIPPYVFAISSGLVFVGLVSAILHLSNPLRAFRAGSNFIFSRLSREIVAVHLFAASLILGGIYRQWFLVGYYPVLEIGISCLGLWMVWTVNQVYHVKTVPVWNHSGTTMDFFGTSLLLGGLLSALIVVVTLHQLSDLPKLFVWVPLTGGIMKIMGLYISGLRFKAAAEKSWYADERIQGKNNYVFQRYYAYGAGLILLFTSGILCSGGWVSATLFITAVVVLFTTEVWNRICFYRSFRRMGL